MKIVAVISMLLFAAAYDVAQVKPRVAGAKPAVKPAATPIPAADEPKVDPGRLDGTTYTNKTFGLEVEFPATWFIPGDDFEAKMREKGYDLRVKVNPTDPQAKANVRRFEKQVTLLLTAYREAPPAKGNAIVHISVEDVSDNPAIKDAVDYFDLMHSQIATMKLPPGFKISDVQAEKLGAMQFGFLDITSNTGKKRLYATVRGGWAIMFTLSYSDDADLATMRRILEEGNFSYK